MKPYERAFAHVPPTVLEKIRVDSTINVHTFASGLMMDLPGDATMVADSAPIPAEVSLDGADAHGVYGQYWPGEAQSGTESVTCLLGLEVRDGIDGPLDASVDIALGAHLGQGGMGVVKVGRQTCLHREVAVKMPPRREQRPERLQTLIREALIMGQVAHPNTVPVHQLGFDGEGLPVIVMRRVVGTEWRNLVTDAEHEAWGALRGDREGQQVRHLEILLQVSHAVSFAHARGVIHRDVKPENVMVGEYGEVYLLDWGVALCLEASENTMTGILGTPAYMAPEMVLAAVDEIGPWSDVYLLGGTLYEALTGRLPHDAPSLFATLQLCLDKPHIDVADPAIPPELGEIIAKATANAKEDRYQTVAAFRDAVNDYLHHRSTIALTHESLALLANFEATVSSMPVEAGETDAYRDLFSQFTHCQTSFNLALRDWPENTKARDGLQRCLEAMIRYGLAARLVPLVRTLLPQLPQARPTLQAEADGLAATMGDAFEAQEALRAMRAERDFSVSLKSKAILAGALLFAHALLTIVVLNLFTATDGTEMATLTPMNLVQIGAGWVVFLGIAVRLGWRWLAKNAISRQAIYALCVLSVVLEIGITVTALGGGTLNQILTQELMMLGCGCAMLAIPMHWWLASACVILFPGAFLCALVPQFCGEIFGSVFLLATSLLMAPLFFDSLGRRIFATTWAGVPKAP